MYKLVKKSILIFVILLIPYIAEAKKTKSIFKEKPSNILCLRVEKVFQEGHRRVDCSESDGKYLLKIKDGNLETYPIDFHIAGLVFYNSMQVMPIIKPLELTIVNVFHESKTYTMKDLNELYSDGVYKYNKKINKGNK